MEAIMAIRDGQHAKTELLNLYKHLVKSVVNKYAKNWSNINEADLETEGEEIVGGDNEELLI